MSEAIRLNYLKISVTETIKCYGVSAVFAFGILVILSLYVNCVVLYYIGGILFLMPILASLVKWKPKERISPVGKAVFITGCDMGFGHLSAQRLDDLGFHVFAGCLFPDGDGATKLRKSGSSRLHVVGIDVTSDDSVQKSVKYVKENLGDNVLWAVINNAGIFEGGELEWIEMEAIKRVFEINTTGVVRVSKAFLPMLKVSKGRIVTIASFGARITFPWMVPYCMSKAATVAFCDGLRLEMYKWGVRVISIAPVLYRTHMMDEFTSKVLIAWERNPKYIKDTYRSNYIQGNINKISKVGKLLSRNPSEVVTTVEEATMSQYPEFYYTPGSLLFVVAVWILGRMPKALADVFLNNY